MIERFYRLGEDDGNVAVGDTASFTADSQESASDGGGPFVDLFGLGKYTKGWTTESPLYKPELSQPSPLAMSFEGGLQWFDGAAFDPRNFNGSFTALSQAWVKPNGAGKGSLQTVWGLGSDNGGVSITDDGFWQLNSGGSAGSIKSQTEVAFDEWSHVAVLRGGNSGTLYLNGAVIATNPGFWNGPGPLVLGAGNLDGANPFLGAIDEFIISGFSDGSFEPAFDIFFPIDVSGVLGDVVQDGVVDQLDYDAWSNNVGFNNGLGAGDSSTLLRGDVDQNGIVNYFDFVIIRREAAAAGVAIVPEPSTFALCAFGAVAWICLRRRRAAAVAAIAACGGLLAASGARAEVVVAEDFYYAQPTKAFGAGGGFTQQNYGGGQNGPAGSWLGQWVSVGDGVITGADITEEGPFTPETDKYLGATNNGLSVNWLERDFAFNGLDSEQSIYFGITMRSNNETATPNSAFFLNDPGGENQIGLGLSAGGFRAYLGPDVDGEPIPSLPGPGLTDGLEPHRLIGKLDFNANGADERITIWLDPTDVETAENSLSYESDVVSGLEELTGGLRLDHVASGGITLWDDLAIGTTWEDVISVNVPRMTLYADPATQKFTFVNTTGGPVDAYFLQTESADGFSIGGWTSLASQGVEGWQENNPGANLLTESNFLGSLVMGDGAAFEWGRVFGRRDTPDVIARVGTTDGLLNLANVVYEAAPVVENLPGDANGDKVVDLLDFNILKENFGAQGGLSEGDFNNDGIIDLVDFNILKENFGASAAVPEPAAWLLLAAFAVPAALRRRR